MELVKEAIPPDVLFRAICLKNGIQLSDLQATQLLKYTELLLDWNKRLNLVSRKDEENIWLSHLLHSAAILFLKKIRPQCSVLDIGTGGGLPGIVLKILRPDISVTLIDATNKKILAVKEMVRALQLDGVDAVWGRAEELGHTTMTRSVELVVARAVAPLFDLTKWALPFLRPGKPGPDHGQNDEYLPPRVLIALKGGQLESEIQKTRLQKTVRLIHEEKIVFDGSEYLGGVEKKIISVYF